LIRLKLKNKYIKSVVGLVLLVVFFGSGFYALNHIPEKSLESIKVIDTKDGKEKEVKEDNNNKEKNETREEKKARVEREKYQALLADLFDYRNKAILNKNENILKGGLLWKKKY